MIFTTAASRSMDRTSHGSRRKACGQPLRWCRKIFLCFTVPPWRTSGTAGPTQRMARSSKLRILRDAASSSRLCRAALQPSSAIDSESEQAIQEVLTKLMRGRTVIAIAHRLSTVHNFDRIVVLRAGQVVQDGPPDQLMRHDGIYRNLVLQEMSRLAKHAA